MIPSSSDAIVAYILDHLSEKLTLKFLADRFKYSEKTLQRYFKHRYHKTVHQFIREERLKLSYKLLITTTHPSKLVAAEVGYRSIQAFNTAFKAYYRFSPEQFRICYDEAWK